ncbi:MAG: sugar ABC transporter permease [Omnitrophica bacterium]|nr:sugar ABC transporter permease [Candidatus Omnitrophota bacterium]
MIDKTIKDKVVNFSFVFPAFVIFSVFYLYPFFYSFILSFQQTDGIYYSKFVGLQNFKEVFASGLDWQNFKWWSITWWKASSWWNSMYNGVFITFWALTFQNILAFALALGVDKAIKTGKIYRVIFFILPVLSEIIIGLLMRELLLTNPGILNQWLEKVGLGFISHNWLGRESVLLTTALVHSWKGFGWAFIILLAGLQTIPEELYEAARIDGANYMQRFHRITLPLLMPVVSLVIVLTLLGTMQAFAMILALTRGAAGLTEVPVMRIYNHLRLSQVGLACAEGIVLGAVLIAVSFTMFNLSKWIRSRWGVLPR